MGWWGIRQQCKYVCQTSEDLREHHVLADNTSAASYINHQLALCLCPLCKLAHQIFLWVKGKLREVYILGYLNQGDDIVMRQGLRPGEWRLHPKVVEQIWRVFNQACLRFRRPHVVHSCSPSPPGGKSIASSPVLAGPSMVLRPCVSPQRLSVGDPCQRDLLTQAGLLQVICDVAGWSRSGYCHSQSVPMQCDLQCRTS